QQREEQARESGRHRGRGLASMDGSDGQELPQPSAHLRDYRRLPGAVRADYPDDRAPGEERLRGRPAPQRAPRLAPRAPAPCQGRARAREPPVGPQPRRERSPETEATDSPSPRLDRVSQLREECEVDARKVLVEQTAHVLIPGALTQPAELARGRLPYPVNQ